MRKGLKHNERKRWSWLSLLWSDFHVSIRETDRINSLIYTEDDRGEKKEVKSQAKGFSAGKSGDERFYSSEMGKGRSDSNRVMRGSRFLLPFACREVNSFASLVAHCRERAVMPFRATHIFAQAKMMELCVSMWIDVRVDRWSISACWVNDEKEKEKRLEMNEANLRKYLHQVLTSEMERNGRIQTDRQRERRTKQSDVSTRNGKRKLLNE